jgi:predicted AAA+ superfamily ATPase
VAAVTPSLHFIPQLDDCGPNIEQLTAFSSLLTSTVIPSFVGRIEAMQVWPLTNLELVECMHSHGISLYHLGAVGMSFILVCF